MLPGSGLFKDLPCPFFQDGQCNRPYCHFKHISAQKKPTYTPTPITKSKLIESSPDPVPKKKAKLEYIPVSSIAITKSLKYNPSSRSKSQQATYVPSEIKSNAESGEDSNEAAKVYVPMKIEDSEVLTQSEIKEEPNIVPDIITEVKIEDPEKKDTDNPKESKENKEQQISDSIKSAEKESPETILKDNNKTKTNGIDIKSEKSENEKKNDKKDRTDHDKSRDRRHSHSKSSSREKEKESRDKKHSSSHSTSSSHKSHKSDKSHKSSSSSSKHRSSSSSKSERSEKPRESDRKHSSSSDKSKRPEKNERSHKSEKSDKHHHSSSSSKSKHRDKDKEKSDKSKEEPKKQEEEKDFVMSQVYEFDEPSLNADYDMNFSSDEEEEEVMKQCRMIFDEYDTTEQEATDVKQQEISSKPVLKEDDPMGESSNSRKRQAHENAEKSRVLPAFLNKPNHVQNAMQSIYMRQEIVRKQKEKELAELEQKKKVLEEELKINNPSNMTPLINPAVFAHPAKRPSIAPVSNLMALQEAKKKVEALKAAKKSPYQILDKTLAKTVSKGESRTAHVAKVDLTSKPAPPVLEPHQRKISYNIRMQYYNIMVTHCLNIYPNCEDAWDRAQTEELSVFNKCSTPNIYKSSALLTINKLKKESIEAGNTNTQQLKTISHDVMLAGKQGLKASWSTNHKVKVADSDSSLMTIDNCSSTQAYELVVDCILTEKQLEENGFPRAGNKRGTAKLFTPKPSKPPKDNERYCSRCSKVFMLDDYDEPGVDLCNYHLKRSGYRRGFADNIYYCCQQSAGSDGCCFGNYHVTDYVDYDNLTGYVTTMDPDEDYKPSKKDMFALDCEMCYTTFGMELTRITVVNFDEHVVYDTLVKPENRIIDYNTKFSGITESSLKNVRTTLRDVQAVLLSMFNSKTILIGHSLDSDLKALKLIHSTVVDTSVLFPHKMGPPRKRALKTLCIEYLKKIIQEDEQGHDSSEDSLVCIQLVKHYLRNRIVYIN